MSELPTSPEHHPLRPTLEGAAQTTLTAHRITSAVNCRPLNSLPCVMPPAPPSASSRRLIYPIRTRLTNLQQIPLAHPARVTLEVSMFRALIAIFAALHFALWAVPVAAQT